MYLGAIAALQGDHARIGLALSDLLNHSQREHLLRSWRQYCKHSLPSARLNDRTVRHTTR